MADLLAKVVGYDPGKQYTFEELSEFARKAIAYNKARVHTYAAQTPPTLLRILPGIALYVTIPGLACGCAGCGRVALTRLRWHVRCRRRV
jgi:hypothetical protein